MMVLAQGLGFSLQATAAADPAVKPPAQQRITVAEESVRGTATSKAGDSNPEPKPELKTHHGEVETPSSGGDRGAAGAHRR